MAEKKTEKDTPRKRKGRFGSRLGFILASAGSAIGIGNIWMFPYRTGQYGGAAFLLLYFGFAILFGIIGLAGEFALGRLTGSGPFGAYEYAVKSRGKRGGAFWGVIPLFGSLGIAMGYSVITGWVLRYIWGALTGQIFQENAAEYFARAAGPFGSIGWNGLAVILTMAILFGGVLKGIEGISRRIMPAFFLLFLFLGIRVFFLEGAAEGYRYLLIPDWSRLARGDTWIMAMGQAFFSLSIAGAGMITYGSYLDPEEDIPFAAAATALLDSLAALLAGFVVIPAVFAMREGLDTGPALLFIALPAVFSQIAGGRLIAVLFFLSVFFAGITSMVNLFETCGEAVQERLGMRRRQAVAVTGLAVMAGGICLESEVTLGKWMDFITIYAVPLGAVVGALMIYWVTGAEKILKELNKGRKRPLGTWYKAAAQYLYVPLALLILAFSVILKGIG